MVLIRRKVDEYSAKHLYNFGEFFIVAVENKLYKLAIEKLIVGILPGFFKEFNQGIHITLLDQILRLECKNFEIRKLKIFLRIILDKDFIEFDLLFLMQFSIGLPG